MLRTALRWTISGILLATAFSVQATTFADSTALREALTLHASFDETLSADFAKGAADLRHFTTRAQRKAGGEPAKPGKHLEIQPEAGQIGGAMYRGAGHEGRLFYPAAKNLTLDQPILSGTVSVWLRTNPDEDIPRAFCDPIMFISDNHRDGFMFLEWSKDHTPRKFRYAILPEYARWNEEDRDWESFPDDQRPMVQLGDRPFDRERWVHVAFTYDQINAGRAGRGALFIDGQPVGEISGWDLTFAWNPEAVIIAVAWNYVGWMDDLAIFDRALTAEEIARLHALPGGVGSLTAKPAPAKSP